MANNITIYTDHNWLRGEILNGVTARELSERFNVSIYIISRHYSKIINSLSVDEIIIIIKKHYTVTGIISPRSSAYSKIKKLTNYLPDATPLKQRFWHIKEDTKEIPKCKICKKKVKWNQDLQLYRIYCSIKCQGKDPDVISKRENTSLRNHGVKYWNQQHIPPNSLKLLNDKEWLYDQHKVKKKSLMQIGKELNVHQLLPAQYLNRYGICGEQTSTAQTQLCDFIKTIYAGEIIENSKKIISPFAIDIFLPELNIAIEYNGIYWHSELAGKDKKYHIKKTILCEGLGIRLIHILENEWLLKGEIVKSRLSYLLNKTKEIIYARKCEIRNVPINIATQFLTENHIQGYCAATINLGLYYENNLVAFCSFTKSRFSKKYEYELVRYCNRIHSTVVGGAGKLFKMFIRNYNPKSIVSYADLRWNTGTLYKQLDFIHVHNSKPNYSYFQNNSLELFSRIKFQKHKLNKLLEYYDSDLTEWENMQNNKYNRIWDCGNSVWVWNKN